MAKKSEARIAKERKRKAAKRRSHLMKQVAVFVIIAVLILMLVFAFGAPPKAM